MSKTSDVVARQREFLFPCVANYYQEPVVITKGEGSRVSDIEGREYVDFFGGILTVSVGHSNSEVAEAVARQMRALGHTSTLYPTEGQLTVAEKLAKLSPGKLKKSFFTNSGSEADETAVMLAKIHTGRTEILALRHGYHGRTHLAVGLTAHHNYRVIPQPIAGIVHAAAPYCYRCPFGQTYPDCGVKCAQDLEEAIQTQTTGKPAAFLAEPILGVGGFITPPKEYFQIAVGIVRKYGGLFICDEVQTGFGRTGGKWFGIEHYGVEPDIMTMAKSIANGFPVGATIATDEVASSWTGATISTYGGNSVSMAATDATLTVMEKIDAPKAAEVRGAELRGRLEQYKETYPWVGDVRGMGLMQAIEVVEDKKSKTPSPAKTLALMEAAKKHGLLLGKGGLYQNTIRISPPLTVTKAEMDDGLARFDKAMAEVK
jgi:alanine-glyoxylate transaminase / (R)-3-amino-2-methylpropionate-pyruvate transaminase